MYNTRTNSTMSTSKSPFSKGTIPKMSDSKIYGSQLGPLPKGLKDKQCQSERSQGIDKGKMSKFPKIQQTLFVNSSYMIAAGEMKSVINTSLRMCIEEKTYNLMRVHFGLLLCIEEKTSILMRVHFGLLLERCNLSLTHHISH